MIAFPSFDEVFVISDLHMGGSTEHQIFDQGKLAAAMVRQLVGLAKERTVCLVINGDLVDFLAEPAATWFDPEGAVGRLERISSDRAFRGVFEALRAFTNTPNCTLAIVLGNHDLELALPWVGNHLLELLSGGEPAARARVVLALDGAGFRCRVGGASVLCVHGNEVDAWNVTDYERLRRIGRNLVHDLPAAIWKPNAGTRLVVEVMNEVKRACAFVELLKPEAEAAVPMLLAIRPDLAAKIADVARVALRMGWDDVKMRVGLLAADEEGGDEAAERSIEPPPMRIINPLSRMRPSGDLSLTGDEALQRIVGGFSPRSTAADRASRARSLLELTEYHMDQEHLPGDLLSDQDREVHLGAAGAWWKSVSGKGNAEVLRTALDSLWKDRSFDLDAPDETFRQLDERLGAGLQYVVAGHTHLRRALRRTRGGGFYYNTGTWARLMRLPSEEVGDDAAAARVFAALKSPTLAAIDNTPYVVRLPTAAWIRLEGATVRGSLLEYRSGFEGVPERSELNGSDFSEF